LGVAKNPEKQVKTLMKNFANFKDRKKKTQNVRTGALPLTLVAMLT
jgi:hypothetical protein